MSTDPRLSKELDKVFKNKFGWKARSEGVFSVGDKSSTFLYGRPFYFFPIGRYKYLWSTHIGDLFCDDYKFSVGRDTGNMIFSKDEVAAMEGLSTHEKEGRIFERMWLKTYKNNRLGMAIRSGHEIMFKCKEYYAVNVMDYTEQEVVEALGL